MADGQLRGDHIVNLGTKQWRIQDFPEGGHQFFTVSTYERHVTSLHNQQAKTSNVIFM